MGLRRFFKNRYREYVLRHQKTLSFRGLEVPIRRAGMNTAILTQIWSDAYETPEITGLTAVIRPGDRVLELGTGLGIVTALASRATGPTGRVQSYEANPALIGATRDFLAEHGCSNTEIIHGVLVPGDKAGTRRFHLAGSFAESSLLGATGRNPQGSLDVPALPMAEAIAAFRPDILICDIEGAEAEVIPAFDASGLRAAVIELHPDRLLPEQISAISSALLGHGLSPVVPGPGGTVVLYNRG